MDQVMTLQTTNKFINQVGIYCEHSNCQIQLKCFTAFYTPHFLKIVH